MTNSLTLGFGQQIGDLRQMLVRERAWPSPSLGFALYVFETAKETVPFDTSIFAVSNNDRRRMDQAPVLAAIGYALASGSLTSDHALLSSWAEGLIRLSARDPFPLDREAFTYRPIELLGISLGATHCGQISASSKEWLANVLSSSEEKLLENDLWHRLLGGFAAFLLSRRWNTIAIPDFEEMNAPELGLLMWLDAVHADYLKAQKIPAEAIGKALITCCATNPIRAYDPAPAAVVLFSLEKAVHQLIGAEMADYDKALSEQAAGTILKTLVGKVDFAIITVREDEHKAVLSRFPKEYIFRGQHRSYSVGRFPLPSGDSYLVAVVKSIEQGEGSGQDVARDIIEDLDPQWILLIGIAGGIPANEFTLGDVVAAIRLHDFSIKASIEGGAAQYAATGGPAEKIVQDRLAVLGAMEEELGDWNAATSLGMPRPPVDLKASALYGSNAWKQRVKASLKRHFSNETTLRLPIVTTGSVATSDSLIKDTQIVQQWEESARQIIAVEMELGGVYQAARRAKKTYPVLAIRGISDIVGFKRHPDWTAYACHSAAAFARAFLLTRPIEPRN